MKNYYYYYNPIGSVFELAVRHRLLKSGLSTKKNPVQRCEIGKLAVLEACRPLTLKPLSPKPLNPKRLNPKPQTLKPLNPEILNPKP